MNLLIISPTIFSGGAQKLILQMNDKIQALGCNVIIVTTVFDKSNIPEKLLENANIEVVQGNLFKKGGSNTSYIYRGNIYIFFLRLIRCWFFIRKIVKDYKIDVMNPHNPPAQWLACFQGKPSVWTCNEPISLWPKDSDYLPLTFDEPNFIQRCIQYIYISVDKLIARMSSDNIIVLSPEGAKRVKNVYKRKSEIVYAGVDYDVFDRNYDRAKLKRTRHLAGYYIIGQVAGITSEKNHEMILNIMNKLKRKIQNIKYIIVGDGPNKPHLECITARENLEDDVIFTGKVSEKELVELYHVIDLLLIPTITSTWGLTPFEALVCGTPCIASDKGGSSFILDKYKIGLICKPTEEDFTNLIIYAFNNKEMLNEMVNRGKLFVRNNLSWSQYAKSALHIFNKTRKQSNIRRLLV